MAARLGTRRGRKGSDGDLVELPPLPTKTSTSRTTPSRRKSAGKAAEETVDVLTPEEEYLLKTFRRYRKNVPASPTTTTATPTTSTTAATTTAGKTSTKSGGTASEKGAPTISKRSPSPVPDRSAATGKPGAHDSGKVAHAAKTDDQVVTPAAAPVPTDAASRLKVILEKKRKAAAASRGGSIASGAAGALRKAKISKVAGAPSSATSTTRLDSVKYPSSGLLLKRDFRTFEQGEEDGERVYTPVEPLIRTLSNFGLADGDGGAKNTQLNETLVMRVTVPPHSQSWGINICPKDHKNFEEVLFHFNPRRRFVAMNNREDNIWGQQEKYMIARWPEMFSVSIIVGVQLDRTGFHVAVDGKYCGTFTYRTPLQANGEELTLQVMTADDYGTNLGLIVHEIWWGHKQTMPGLPGAAKERTPARSADARRGADNDETFVDLHVGNLPPVPAPEQQEAVRKRLADISHPYGVIQVRVFHREKTYGFIKFRDHTGAAKALEKLSGEEIQGRTIRLSVAGGR